MKQHIHPIFRHAIHMAPCLAVLLAGCGDLGTGAPMQGQNDGAPLYTNAQSSLMAGYKQARWGSNVSVTFPDDCSMTIVSNGLPNHRLPAWYLMPSGSNNGTGAVVKTPDGHGLAVTANPNTPSPITMRFNICPTKAAKTTETNMGMTGVMISGAALFNAFDAGKTPALQQNQTHVFTDAAGNRQAAGFIDECAGHFTPARGRTEGGRYHYHGLSSCVTAQTDTSEGPSHIIGVALDGYPVYGSRDIQGRPVDVSSLDACNGIDSPTPEFPQGVYHYVLPQGVSGAKSAPGCYSGNVSRRQMWLADAGGICSTPTAQTAGGTLPNGQDFNRALAYSAVRTAL